ncbi:hypothetical protein [Nostoc sp. FACHB-892]|nr:hypothetical protein [Nostoc sp. FACHB-892]
MQRNSTLRLFQSRAHSSAARCSNFRLQLTTSLTSWWKLEVAIAEPTL